MCQLPSWAKERERKRRAREEEDQEEPSGLGPDSKRRRVLISSSAGILKERADEEGEGEEKREDRVEPRREDDSNTIFPSASDAESSATLSPSPLPPSPSPSPSPSLPPQTPLDSKPYTFHLAAAHYPLPSKTKRHTHRVNILVYDPRITATAIIYLPTPLALSIPFTQAMERDAGGECEFVSIRSRSRSAGRGWYICSLLAELQVDGVGEIRVKGKAKVSAEVVPRGMRKAWSRKQEQKVEQERNLGVAGGAEDGDGSDSSTTLINDDDGDEENTPLAAAQSLDTLDAFLPTTHNTPIPLFILTPLGPKLFTRHPRDHYCSIRLPTNPGTTHVAEIRQCHGDGGGGGKAHLRLRFRESNGGEEEEEEVVVSGPVSWVRSRVVVGDKAVVLKRVS
ncbi:hypothetical protein LTR86_006462 [Recurvomyces mirabilis]|nr:hypothetical protein LTR86_006462 [Recurvomyces mirabilis]